MARLGPTLEKRLMRNNQLTVILLVIIFAVIGAYFVLWALGQAPSPAAALANLQGRSPGSAAPVATAPPQVQNTDSVPQPSKDAIQVALAARAINAGEMITREKIMNADGRSSIAYVEPKDLAVLGKREEIIAPELLIGRVARDSIAVGQAITERSLRPVGTRPGVASAIPAGMRGLTLDANRVQGAHMISRGDRIDIVAAVPLKEESTSGSGSGSKVLAAPTAETTELVPTKFTGVRLVLNDGLVVAAVRPRVIPGTPGPRGEVTPGRTVEEFTIAGKPEEIAKLTEALGNGSSLILSPRSGQPGESEDQRKLSIPERTGETVGAKSEAPKTHTIETLVGDTRSNYVLPARPAKK